MVVTEDWLRQKLPDAQNYKVSFLIWYNIASFGRVVQWQDTTLIKSTREFDSLRAHKVKVLGEFGVCHDCKVMAIILIKLL